MEGGHHTDVRGAPPLPPLPTAASAYAREGSCAEVTVRDPARCRQRWVWLVGVAVGMAGKTWIQIKFLNAGDLCRFHCVAVSVVVFLLSLLRSQSWLVADY